MPLVVLVTVIVTASGVWGATRAGGVGWGRTLWGTLMDRGVFHHQVGHVCLAHARDSLVQVNTAH